MDRTQVAGAAASSGPRAAAAIRPVCPADEAVLREFFAALSVESRYLRFFAPVTPSCGLLDLMAGKPAHVDAIIAVADGVIVGHAMAADRPVPGDPVPGTPAGPGEPRATDVGVVVADAWQRRGVGATLMRALIDRAQARGVTALAMDVLPGNRRVLAMITGHWPQAAVGHAADSVDIRIPLPPPAPRPRAARLAIQPVARPAIRPVVQPAAVAAGKALAAVGR
ncbi:MAG TPA: GNAT family N-acetyltransferase [Streptosporangiaceae bacterium]|jgi:GNAT superfamily N-acetyltransferase